MPKGSDTHILVVDDDPKIRALLRRLFQGEGWRVSEASTSSEVRDCLAHGKVHLITLDLTLADDDGLSIARDVRQHHDVPIIIVSGKGDTIDRVVGLELGADDYIAKPFHIREVLARVRAVLRRTDNHGGGPPPAQPPQHEAFAFDGWIVDLTRRELRSADGPMMPLTTAEFSLLEMFVRHPNRVLSRDRIMDLLKGHEWNPFDRTIDNMVARLRRKIEKDPDQPLLIKTVRGVGYSFTCDVIRRS